MSRAPCRARAMSCWCGALALALFAQTALAASLDRLRAFVRDTQTVRAAFTQQQVDRAGRTLQEARGTFAIARPGKFRWSVDAPYKQLLVGDGARVWIYDPDLNQVITRKNDQALGATPAALLSGREDVERAFDWHDLPASGGLDWLSATPKDKESTFAHIDLGFDGAALAALEIADRFGQHTTIRITSLERNPSLPADLFTFVPPKGADVVSD